MVDILVQLVIVVELTIALHYVYNTPDDSIVWDVGHQAYGHKILTGRKKIFTQTGYIKAFLVFLKFQKVSMIHLALDLFNINLYCSWRWLLHHSIKVKMKTTCDHW